MIFPVRAFSMRCCPLNSGESSKDIPLFTLDDSESRPTAIAAFSKGREIKSMVRTSEKQLELESLRIKPLPQQVYVSLFRL